MSAVLVPDDWEKDLPQPLFWRVLVRPKIAREMSKGGIALASSVVDAEDTLNYLGQVIAMGALAYTHERLRGEHNRPEVGDWVAYGRYSGQVTWFKGVRLLVVNDDEILLKVPNPETIKIYA